MTPAEQSLRAAIQEVLDKLLPAKLVFTPDMEEPGAMKRLTAQFMYECLEELLFLISKHVEVEKLEARIEELRKVYGDGTLHHFRVAEYIRKHLASLNNERKK